MHSKQSLQKIRVGAPKLDELQEGVQVTAIVKGQGVFNYIRINNKIYRMAWSSV